MEKASLSLQGEQAPQLKVLFSRREIEHTVTRLARQISQDYRGENPLLMGILRGSFIFLSDLVRRLDISAEIEFVWVSSYGKGPGERWQVPHTSLPPLPY